jgi:class 3 adenylate cyclase
MRFAEKPDALGLLALMSGYFAVVGDILENAGGWLVKTVGDAGLGAFPAEHTDTGVRAFLKLKEEGDAWLAEQGIRSEAIVKLHVGPVAFGEVAGQLDIYGHTVNTAAVMVSGNFAMSPQVFRKLEPDTRNLFKKHTPPVTYIPTDASHRAERSGGWKSMV